LKALNFLTGQARKHAAAHPAQLAWAEEKGEEEDSKEEGGEDESGEKAEGRAENGRKA
jgi:hypothetical protein